MSLLAPWDFYFRAFRSPGSPRAPAGYHYEAKLRIASAGLSPASTAASLAAPRFVTFSTKHQPARTGRNPRTGESLEIAASTTPTFKPGKPLRDSVNDGSGSCKPFRSEFDDNARRRRPLC